jgi:hypothetical protein
MLYVDRRFKGQGFAPFLYEREGTLYERWRVNEIQLRAEKEGRTYWVRKSFQFKAAYPDILRASYRRWAKDREDVPPDPPDELHEYPPEFLTSAPELVLYKVVTP